MKAHLSLERLESRENPGGDLLTLPTLPIWAGMVGQQAQSAWHDITLPKTDLVLISSSRDGRPSRYLDLAHNAFKKSTDVGSVRAMTAEIDSAFARNNRKPITLIVVATETEGASGIIVGRDYIFRNSDPMQTLLSSAGEVREITWLVDNAKPKSELYQAMADGLRQRDSVRVASYSGALRVRDGSPAVFISNGEWMTWDSTVDPGKPK